MGVLLQEIASNYKKTSWIFNYKNPFLKSQPGRVARHHQRRRYLDVDRDSRRVDWEELPRRDKATPSSGFSFLCARI
jgi:hypothetical protein